MCLWKGLLELGSAEAWAFRRCCSSSWRAQRMITLFGSLTTWFPKAPHPSQLVLTCWDGAEWLFPCTRWNDLEPSLSWVSSDSSWSQSKLPFLWAAFTDHPSPKGTCWFACLPWSSWDTALYYCVNAPGRENSTSLNGLQSPGRQFLRVHYAHFWLASLSFILWNTNTTLNGPEPLHWRGSYHHPERFLKRSKSTYFNAKPPLQNGKSLSKHHFVLRLGTRTWLGGKRWLHPLRFQAPKVYPHFSVWKTLRKAKGFSKLERPDHFHTLEYHTALGSIQRHA